MASPERSEGLLASGQGLPGGTVTLLFTDVEGSTRLLQQLGERYGEELGEHRRLLRAAFAAHGGQEVDTQGDSFFVVFARAAEAIAAAAAGQRSLAAQAWPDGAVLRVRMGLHTGEPTLTGGGYVGLDVHRAARLCAAGHGGQVLLSQTTRDLVEQELPAGLGLKDIGEHRLKDLPRPEQIYQLVMPGLPDDFPSLRTLDVSPNNLPAQLTSFVGRDRELAEVRRLLATTRLLTLTGAGGAGKTRLALELAADLLEAYPQGVWLVELAPLAEPALVPQAVASALGVPEQPGRSPERTLADYLRPRQLLLVLDNCEHLIEACAGLADSLLRACPSLNVLATSREALGIGGETAWRLPSLSLPDLQHLPPTESLTQYEAVRLFVERAVAALPSFNVTNQNAPAVAQICHRLDGIPLAIELAAARVKLLTPEQIAARLDDCFRLLTGGSRTALARQQTLRAAIDWSYGLLSEPERILLRRLSVFAGGWTLEAAEAICAFGAGSGVGCRVSEDEGGGLPTPGTRDLTPEEVLDLLGQLVDKSLVLAEEQEGEARYRLLETVRQYARERLLEGGEAAVVRDRHRDWFFELVERAEPKLYGSEQAVWFERLETELDNLRVALAWCQSDPSGAERALQLALALRWFLALHGHMREGQERLAELLAVAQAPAARAKGLLAAGSLAHNRGEYELSRVQLDEALGLFRELGDGPGEAGALAYLGQVAQKQGDLEQATRLLQESQALFGGPGAESDLPFPIAYYLAETVLDAGDQERAGALYEQSLSQSKRRGDQHGVANSIRGLGRLALSQGDPERALALLVESLALVWKLKDQRCARLSIEGLARATSTRGSAERAARLFGIADMLREVLGTKLAPAERPGYERDRASVRAALGGAAFAAAWEEGRAMPLERAVAYALETDRPT